MSGTRVILRPMLFELAAMFAAGYVVGKYTQQNVPTIAEARAVALEAAEHGEIVDVENMVGKKPFLSYDGEMLHVNIGKARRRR